MEKKGWHSNMTREDMVKYMTSAFKIFQDGAYKEELEKKKYFKYSDYCVFSNTKSNFNSLFKGKPFISN